MSIKTFDKNDKGLDLEEIAPEGSSISSGAPGATKGDTLRCPRF